MKHFRIAHRLVRRLRVIAPPLIGEQERCYILEILLRKHAAIRDVRIVPEIGSLTVRYDPAVLPEQRLLATLDAILGNLLTAPPADTVEAAPVDEDDVRNLLRLERPTAGRLADRGRGVERHRARPQREH